ncbi:MAG: ABC transporter ATP-binding protein [Anaerolineae bacterium]|nr:ABC transporter ATP-binding protein [Anaerolineae bacterium]
MSSLTLQNVSKNFGAVRAVQSVDLTVKDGEFISLLGPSGCGKTTTLRIVAGLELCDSGNVVIGDKDVTMMPPGERDIAMVFQDYALYPHMDVLDNVGYPLKVRGVQRAELQRRVHEVAVRLQIEALLERRPGQLSGGQQQRVALARAVVHPAKITLYDEPLSNLDAQLRNEARIFLKHLQQEVGATSLYVTHDQAEAMALSDRIVVMNQGKVMQIGTPMEIYRTPANSFVASFIGNPPMNLLACQVDASANLLRLGDGAALPFAGLRGSASLGGKSKVTLGIRPEHVTIHTTPKDGCLPARLYIIQELGSEILTVFHTEKQLVTVRLYTDEPPHFPEQVWLELNPAYSFLYDENGQLIS